MKPAPMVFEHICLGIDPDTRSTALALVTMHKVLQVLVVRSKPEEDDDQAAISMIRNLRAPLETIVPKAGSCVVEGQQIYLGRFSARPESILSLALVAGGLVATCSMLGAGDKPIWVPTPAQWKGQVPKHIHQGRMYEHFGIKYEMGKDYSWPSGCAAAARISGYGKVNRSDWRHIGDAIGLGLWGCLYREKLGK